MHWIISVIWTICILLLLVFVHEFGHFLVAKACNTKVNELALGMGPAIWQRKKGETMYSVRALPLGGYCAFNNENGVPEEEREKLMEDESYDASRDLPNKKWWQKLLIMMAGPAMNILFCIIILGAIFFVGGMATTSISAVDPGSPAEAAGILAGDRILEVDGVAISQWSDIAFDKEDAEAGNSVTVKYMRDGETHSTEVVPTISEDGSRGVIGIRTKVEHSVIKSAGLGIQGTIEMTKLMVKVIVGLFTGATGTDVLSGPVGIVSAVGQSTSMGVPYMAYLAAIISLNLAIFNLLPIPALDGGRMLFVIIRLLGRGKITDEMEGKFHFAGSLLLVVLVLVVTYSDVLRIFRG